MRKLLTLASTLATATLLAVSCQQTTEFENPQNSDGISFKSRFDTKATDTSFDDGDEISVFAIDENDEYYAQNVKYTFSANSFNSVSPISYASNGQELSFCAIYPYIELQEGSTTNFEIAADQSQGDNYTKSDIIVGTTEPTSSQTPTLDFYHALSKTVITVVESDVELTDAEISINAKRSLELSFDDCTTVGEVSALKMAEDGTNSFKAIVAPQTIGTGSTFGTLTAGGQTYDFSLLEEREFKAGKCYGYDLYIQGGIATLTLRGEDVPDYDEMASVTLSENEYKSVCVDVEVDDRYTGGYAIFPMALIELEEFGNDVEAYAQAFISDDIASYGTDYTDPDYRYVFDGSIFGFNVLDSWNLDPQYEYQIVAVGVDADGLLCTNVGCTEAFYPAQVVNPSEVVFPDSEFGQINPNTIGGTSFTYSISPIDQVNPYAVFAATKEGYDSYASDADRFAADMTYLADTYFPSGYTMEQIINDMLPKGNIVENELGGLDYESDYVIYAYGIDASTLQPTTKIEVLNVTTDPYVAPTGEIASITISNIEMNDATATIDAGTYNGVYYFYPVAATKVDETFGGDKVAALQDMLNIEKMFGMDMTTPDNVFLYQGNVDTQVSVYWDIAPFTEYYVLAAGVDAEGAITTDVAWVKFTTAGLPDDFVINIEVTNITDTGATVSTSPSPDGISYISDVMETKIFETMTPEEITSYVVDNLGSMIIYYLVTSASGMNLEGYVLPGREYTVFSFSYYTASGRLSDIFTKEFKTTGTYVPDEAAEISSLHTSTLMLEEDLLNMKQRRELATIQSAKSHTPSLSKTVLSLEGERVLGAEVNVKINNTTATKKQLHF